MVENHEIDKSNLLIYLSIVEKYNASDLHLKTNHPASIRVADGIHKLDNGNLSEKDLSHMADMTFGRKGTPEYEKKSNRMMELYHQNGSVDYAFEVPKGNVTIRYRTQLYKSRGQMSIAIRKIRPDIPDFKQLNLPDIYEETIMESSKGIIVVGGETGSGKSTTLAAMINYINTHDRKHIITIEDPIEYQFNSINCIINQRELGEDFGTFDYALKAAVREDPDIILVGEMRDKETIDSAIRAAETGHLVLTTLHTGTAPSTFDRILNYFPEDEKPGIRANLANNLIAIMNQMLVPMIGNDGNICGRVPATEVLINNAAVQQYIEEGESSSVLADAMDKQRAAGMRNFNDSLAELVQRDMISHDVAKKASLNSEQLISKLKGISTTGKG